MVGVLEWVQCGGKTSLYVFHDNCLAQVYVDDVSNDVCKLSRTFPEHLVGLHVVHGSLWCCGS